MNSAGWMWFAIGYQSVFAYAVSLMIYQFGSALTGSAHPVGLVFAVAVLVFIMYMLLRPQKNNKERNAV